MPKHAAATSGAAIAHHFSEDREEGAKLETQTGQTRADRLVPLPENVLSLSTVRRSWNGVSLDVISAHCQGRVAHHLCYESHTRLAALLEEVGSPCEPRLREHEPCATPYVPRHLSQSHFSHAFRVSTGVAPYRWQLDARIRRAQRLLLEKEQPLEEVAEHRS